MPKQIVKFILILLVYFCVCAGIGYGYGALLTKHDIDLSVWNAAPLFAVIFLGGIAVRKLFFK